MTFYSNVKQKSYVLNPRGKPLYEDSNRFGTKMLEKMGWSKGKGLGIKEDGEQNFIRVSHKMDQKGMGYQDRDDQWTGHENNFNSLLESLHSSKNASENESDNNDIEITRSGFGFDSDEKKTKKDKSIKAKLSGKSLEEMSKTSGVRVHYKKFTRGKDTSRYSEKDLANIFGKKCIDGATVEKTEDEPQQPEKQAEEVSENILGFKSIETGISVQDYFKKKQEKVNENTTILSQDDAVTEIPEKKRRKKEKSPKSDANEENSIDEGEILLKKEKKKKKKLKRDSMEEMNSGTNAAIVISEEDSDCEIVSVKMKKKKKKSKKCNDAEQTEQTEPQIVVEDNSEDNSVELITKTKKKKKRDKRSSTEATGLNSEVNINDSTQTYKTQFIDGILNILVNNTGISSAASDNSIAEQSETQEPNPKIMMDEVFEINRYHAEMFRFVDLDGFPNSNLSELSGYGYGRDFQLKISEKSKDQTKINDLWDYALINKYGKEVIQAKKAKRYSIKHLKKKNLFKGV